MSVFRVFSDHCPSPFDAVYKKISLIEQVVVLLWLWRGRDFVAITVTITNRPRVNNSDRATVTFHVPMEKFLFFGGIRRLPVRVSVFRVFRDHCPSPFGAAYQKTPLWKMIRVSCRDAQRDAVKKR
jgi:hypothetical protein